MGAGKVAKGIVDVSIQALDGETGDGRPADAGGTSAAPRGQVHPAIGQNPTAQE